MKYDVAIIGAGLTGLCAAWVLNQRQELKGKLVVIDRNERYPVAFRAEKIEPHQAKLFRKFGVLEFRQPLAEPIGETWIVRDGQLSRRFVKQYGIRYHDMVNELRSKLEGLVAFEIAKVTDVSISDDMQNITLSKGQEIQSRLAVICTGGTSSLLSSIGLVHPKDSCLRSLSFGFDIARDDGKPFAFRSLNYYLDASHHQIDYVTIFLIGNIMRINLFTQWESKDPRVREFRDAPLVMMHEYFPGLSELTGQFSLTSKVEVFPTRFYQLEDIDRPGMVVLADDFQSVSPTTGTGLNKVAVDVDLLCYKYIPQWLSTPGMPKSKIMQFYRDPTKIRVDNNARNRWMHFHQAAFAKDLSKKAMLDEFSGSVILP